MINAFVKITDSLAEAAKHHIVVTPNERLARELRRGLNQWQQQHGNQAWLTPQCLSLSQLLASQFTLWQDRAKLLRQLLPRGALLSRFYQTASPGHRHLSSSAAQAQELVYRYDIDLQHLKAAARTAKYLLTGRIRWSICKCLTSCTQLSWRNF